MRLTWKDGIATVLVGLVVVAALSVAGAWGWPLLGSYRVATIMLAVVGVAACAFAGGGTSAGTKEPPSFKGPLGAISWILHLGVAVLVIFALVAPSETVVLLMAATIAAIWVVGTVHHVVDAPKVGRVALR
jgi:hypothetical protein